MSEQAAQTTENHDQLQHESAILSEQVDKLNDFFQSVFSPKQHNRY